MTDHLDPAERLSENFTRGELDKVPFGASLPLRSVMSLVAGVAEEFQIVRRVVVAIPVYVVDNLVWLKKATKFALHNQPVFEDVALHASRRMSRRANPDVEAANLLLPVANPTAFLTASVAGALRVLHKKLFAAYLANLLIPLEELFAPVFGDAFSDAAISLQREKALERFAAVGALDSEKSGRVHRQNFTGNELA